MVRADRDQFGHFTSGNLPAMNDHRILVDAVGIRSGGAGAVCQELLWWLPRVRPNWNWHVLLFDQRLRQFSLMEPNAASLTVETTCDGDVGWQRLRWVRRSLPARIAGCRPSLFLSLTNIAPSPALCPQVVLCQQALPFSRQGLRQMSWLARQRYHFMRRCIVRSARASNAVLVQTAALRTEMAKAAPDIAERIHVVPSGYRTLEPNAPIRPAIAQLVANAGRPRLIYVTLPRPYKNVEAASLALPAITKAFRDTSLLLTLEPTAPFVERTIEAAAASGMDKRIIWLGNLTPAEVRFALAQCDLLLHPSRVESFGLVLAEAMAAGCPIAAADLPYARDVAGAAAVYFDSERPDHLAEVVCDLLRDARRIAELREVATGRKRDFAYESIAERIATMLEEVAALPPGVPYVGRTSALSPA